MAGCMIRNGLFARIIYCFVGVAMDELLLFYFYSLMVCEDLSDASSVWCARSPTTLFMSNTEWNGNPRLY